MSEIRHDQATGDAKLHLGWREGDGSPLILKFQKVCHHGAVLAGSGAGKSTVMGRVVEEILLKTRARVVVIDTNGDFRKAHIVADSDGAEGAVWKADSPSPTEIDRTEFEERWRQLSKVHLTASPIGESMERLKCPAPLLSWTKLPEQWQMDILGLELGRNPEEVAALYEVNQRLVNEGALGDPASPETIDKELEMLATTSTIMNPFSDRKTATALQMRFRQAAQLQVWRRSHEDVDLSHWFDDPVGDDEVRLCTFDVPSISEPTSANILIAFLLKVVWEVAKKNWDMAVQNPAKDKRAPVFLVVDEAHNFVPAEDPFDPHAGRISQSIQRIAAEGRKYGLFLLLATQRPSKVRAGLLSECENVCLLRLRSPIERGLAVDTWALAGEHKETNPPLAHFQRGQGLLCGAWADWNEIHFRAGGRRTKATGGNLTRDWIHTDETR